MPFLVPPPPSQPARGDKRRLVVIALAVALIFAGVAAYHAVRASRPACLRFTHAR